MSSFAKPQVGFVGTGNMGGPMAKNLASKGYQVFAFDAVMQFFKKIYMFMYFLVMFYFGIEEFFFFRCLKTYKKFKEYKVLI
jgi:6-phosphogluconate dehydrogenase